jgi:NifU-like protein involved in Fe-S cluster formation
MPAIATKLLLLLYFSQHVSAPKGHLQVEYNINCLSEVQSILQRIRCFLLSAHAVQTTLTLLYSFVI